MKKPAGFTLTEVLISIFVGMVIIAAIYAAVVASQRSTVNIERKVVAGQDARAALELMALEIQMASYNPTYATGMWREPVNCTGSGNQNSRGIQTATDSSITVEADINGNGGVLNSGSPNINPNEIITYTYDAVNQYITRESGCGGNQPFLGDRPTSDAPRSVRVINTAAVPVFRYFNAQGAEILPAALPAGIPNIARIDITLWVETEDKDASSGLRRRMIYSTNVIPRNHVIIN
jgi:type II secretory pathway pseudopilin PulG